VRTGWRTEKNLPVPGYDPRSSNAQAVTVLVSINNLQSPSTVASSAFVKPLDCGTNKAVHAEVVKKKKRGGDVSCRNNNASLF